MGLAAPMSVMLIARTTSVTLEEDPVLWDVKVDFMEILVTAHAQRVGRNVTETPVIVRERVLITNTEVSVSYLVVRVVQVDVIKRLVFVMAVSSGNLGPTVIKPATSGAIQAVLRIMDIVHAKPDGKGINVTVRAVH
jgi:hypothetical protein